MFPRHPKPAHCSHWADCLVRRRNRMPDRKVWAGQSHGHLIIVDVFIRTTIDRQDLDVNRSLPSPTQKADDGIGNLITALSWMRFLSRYDLRILLQRRTDLHALDGLTPAFRITTWGSTDRIQATHNTHPSSMPGISLHPGIHRCPWFHIGSDANPSHSSTTHSHCPATGVIR